MKDTNETKGIEKRRRDLLELLRALTASAMSYQQACDKPPTSTGRVRNQTDLRNTSRAFRNNLKAVLNHCGHSVSKEEQMWVLDFYKNTPPWNQ